ncbi:TBCC domain containing protein [Asbolus verrucosus]|uniref:TBCC domain containing protein n=1 Tax=Asbolus verrucosus TaxID=1661398 RepID=A0A482W5J3_ASBVE|nr:TBCC domain containing protein [Asbolus verrucosus]
MEVMEGGIDKISLITKRDVERKLGLQKRKEDRNNLSADNEKLGFFEETFTNKRLDIENLLERSNHLEKTMLPDHFNTISKEILLLQKYVASSNIFLRSYDIKKCQESLQELTVKSKELEDELLPKRKFGFKNKTKPNPQKKKQPNSKDEVDFHSKSAVTTKYLCGFTNKTGETLVMSGNDIYKKDVTAENLNNCKIKFLGCPSTLHLNHLKDCYVFSGPVSTSIFADNCSNCTLVIACQQLRLHSSKNVNIYLHVTSRAIMEDCHDIFLAPYNLKYDNLDKDFQESGLDRSTNNWKCIDDFNWLNIEKPSPNWSLLKGKDVVDVWDNII